MIPGNSRSFATVWRASVLLLFVLSACFAITSWAQSPSSRALSKALGSLQITGDVSLNGTAAAFEQSVFPSDLVRTGMNGGAVLTLPGIGMMTVEPNTEVALSGDRYLATLHLGTLDIRSSQAEKNVGIEFGKMVAYLPFFESESAGTITLAADGRGHVLCRAGQVGVSATTGTAVVFLKPGQSVGTTAAGEIGQVESTSAASTASETPKSSGGATNPAGRSHGTYILVGAVAAAGAGAGIALALQHHNSPTSPTSP